MSDSIVEVLYNYDSTTERGHGIHVLAGERFHLISNKDTHWWYVGKTLPARDGFYLPKTYLRIVTDGPLPNTLSKCQETNGYRDAPGEPCVSSSASSSPVPPCEGHLLRNRRVSTSIPVNLEQVGLNLDLMTIGQMDGHSERFFSSEKSHPDVAGPFHTHSCSLDGDWRPGSDALHVRSGDGPRSRDCGQRNQTARSRSPIYANLQDGCEPVPAVSPDMEPIRSLSNGWLEYVSPVGRPFYYHPASGLSSWKPPRSVNLTSDQFPSDCTYSVHRELMESALCGSGSGAEYCSVPVVSGQGADSDKAEHCVRVSVQDFSELNRLLSTSQHHPMSTQRSRSSLTASMYNPCMSASDGAFRLTTFVRPSQKVIKAGNLSRCKFMESGKRVRKHWFTCFVYLTNAHVIFYKDEKSSEKQGNQYAAPLGVCDLRGARIKWLDDEKSRRKRLFQLELVDGTAYLFHAENESEIIGWFDTLQEIVTNLPHPGYNRTPVIERGSYKGAVRRCPVASDQRASQRDTKSLLESKEKLSASGHDPSNSTAPPGSVDAVVPSKQSILEKLVRFFRNRPSIEFLKEKGIYKPEPVFGSSLMEICRREKGTVPKFVTVCTTLIEERGLETDGLYRMSGNLSQIQKIRCSVDQDKYNVMLNENDIHVLTGTLKLFFRELQEPLFPPSLMKDFMNAIKLQNAKLRFKAFKELVGRLPPPHHDTLNVLLGHLLKVAEKSSKNRMQIHNLAIVFGPTLFSSSPKPESSNQRRKKSKKNVSNVKVNDVSTSGPDVVQSNSHLAFSMIMHGQIVEYMLKEHAKLFRAPSTCIP